MAKLKFDLECPSCHRKFKQKVEDVRPGQSRRCPHCGTVIEFTGDDGRQMQRAVDKLERSIKKASRTIKIKF
jgi:uncharacterized Zn finger protein